MNQQRTGDRSSRHIMRHALIEMMQLIGKILKNLSWEGVYKKTTKILFNRVKIMRTFIKLREALIDNKDLRRELEELKQITEERFQIVFETLDQLLTVESKPKKKIGYTVKEKQKAYGKNEKKTNT